MHPALPRNRLGHSGHALIRCPYRSHIAHEIILYFHGWLYMALDELTHDLTRGFGSSFSLRTLTPVPALAIAALGTLDEGPNFLCEVPHLLNPILAAHDPDRGRSCVP